MARILVIDDDLFVRRAIAYLLQALGHETAEAENGREGVQMQRSQRYDMVITDMTMPVQDGLVTIQMLKREFDSLPIIAMSDGTPIHAEVRRSEASLAGARVILNKPFTTEDLVRAMVRCQDVQD
ncbi:MAG: response regulator [Rhodospirillaceae bacterium]